MAVSNKADHIYQYVSTKKTTKNISFYYWHSDCSVTDQPGRKIVQYQFVLYKKIFNFFHWANEKKESICNGKHVSLYMKISVLALSAMLVYLAPVC